MAGLRFRVVGAQQRIPPTSLPLRRGRSPLLFPRGPRGRAPASGTGPGCSEPRRRAARRRCGAAPGRERPEAAPLPAPGGDFAAGGRALAGLPPLLSSPLLSFPRLPSPLRPPPAAEWAALAAGCRQLSHGGGSRSRCEERAHPAAEDDSRGAGARLPRAGRGRRAAGELRGARTR